MGFGARSDSKLTGSYFILGRVIGVIVLGMVIASIGFIFQGYTIYLLVIFGVLTIIFGLLVIFNKNIGAKLRLRPHFKLKPTATDGGTKIKHHCCRGKNDQNGLWHKAKFNNKYAFGLGLFRGATPCLKMIVLAPLLITVDIYLAFLMMLAYVGTSTIYPIIGHLTANIVTKFDKYDIYIRISGAILLVVLGTYSIVKILFLDAGTHFGV
jgi:cytochrome c biogenesis protein CcdA